MEKIVVSGGSRGIGKALVKELVARGHEVFTFARSYDSVNQLVRETTDAPGRVHVFVFDVLNSDFSDLAAEVKKTMGSVTRLVNNAGMLVNKPFLETQRGELEAVFGVNVLSVFPLVQHLFPLLAEGSHIVNITSMGGFQGSVKFSGLSAYSAAKGALAVLTESMALELEPFKIRVNALALGAVQTEMLAAAFPEYTAPLSSEEMATFMADFTLTGNRYFSGKILPVSLSTP